MRIWYYECVPHWVGTVSYVYNLVLVSILSSLVNESTHVADPFAFMYRCFNVSKENYWPISDKKIVICHCGPKISISEPCFRSGLSTWSEVGERGCETEQLRDLFYISNFHKGKFRVKQYWLTVSESLLDLVYFVFS